MILKHKNENSYLDNYQHIKFSHHIIKIKKKKKKDKYYNHKAKYDWHIYKLAMNFYDINYRKLWILTDYKCQQKLTSH